MSEPTIISHWYHLIENLQASSQEFYKSIAEAVRRRQVPKHESWRAVISEGGMFSSNREYLRIKSDEFIFDICAAPFGTGFFVSWWLIKEGPGCLASLPLIGFIVRWFIKPLTYYKIDAALMFQQSVHNAVLEVIDETTKEKGVRKLSELERKPILREFYQR